MTKQAILHKVESETHNYYKLDGSLWTIAISNGLQNSYFENELTESSGTLLIKGKMIVDYDGVHELPLTVVKVLRRLKTSHFLGEVYRVRWMFIVTVSILLIRELHILPETSPLLLILHKLAIVSLALIIGHIARSQLFPYIDLASLKLRAEQPLIWSYADALVFLGCCVLTGLVYLGFLLGITLGL